MILLTSNYQKIIINKYRIFWNICGGTFTASPTYGKEDQVLCVYVCSIKYLPMTGVVQVREELEIKEPAAVHGEISLYS